MHLKIRLTIHYAEIERITQDYNNSERSSYGWFLSLRWYRTVTRALTFWSGGTVPLISEDRKTKRNTNH